MSILSRKITITVSAGTSLIVQVGWNASSAMFDPSRGAVDSSIEKHYQRELLDIVWMTLSLQHGTGISAPAVGEDVRPWRKSQIHPFNKHDTSTPMAASTQGYSGITCTELGVGNIPYTLQQITHVVAHKSANTRQVAAETWEVAMRDCVNKRECTYGLVLPISIYRAAGADIFLTYTELPWVRV